MIIRLIATFVLAFGVAGIVVFLNRFVFKGRLPQWVLPVSIAVAIVSAQVIDEFAWYPRMQSKIEGEYVVLQEHRAREFWRPWSYISPTVTSITVVNKNNMQSPASHPEIKLGYMTNLSSYGAQSDVPFAFDCTKNRFGPVVADIDDIPWADMDEAQRALICSE